MARAFSSLLWFFLFFISFCVLSSPRHLDSVHWFSDDLQALPGDINRKVQKEGGPLWLTAVGRINGEASSICSAVLIEEENKSPYVITLKQCVKEKPVVVIEFEKSGVSYSRRATKTTFMGDNWYDEWVLLELETPFENSELRGLPLLDWVPQEEHGVLIVAGYSADKTKKLGNNGGNLTYDDGCQLSVSLSNIPSWQSLSSCFAYPGSQGGAYIYLSPEGKYYLAGIVAAMKPGIVYAIKTSVIKSRLSGFKID